MKARALCVALFLAVVCAAGAVMFHDTPNAMAQSEGCNNCFFCVLCYVVCAPNQGCDGTGGLCPCTCTKGLYGVYSCSLF